MVRQHLSRIAVIGLLAVTPNAFSLSLEADVAYVGDYASNSRQAPDGQEESNVTHRPTLSVAADHDVRSVQIGANYQVYRQIARRDFDDRTVTRGTGFLRWNTWNNRLDASLTNTRFETNIDSDEPDTLDNRDVVDTTAADLTLEALRIGNQRLVINAGAEKSNLSGVGADSERYTGSVEYVLPLSNSVQTSLFANYANIEFDDIGNDYLSRSRGVRLNYTRARLTASLEVADTVSDLTDVTRESFGGTTGGLNINYALSEDSNISLAVTRNLNDNELRDIQDPFIQLDLRDTNRVITNNAGQGQVFISTNYNLVFNTELGRTALSAGYSLNKFEYDGEDLISDQERNLFFVNVGRQFSNRLGANMNFWYFQNEDEDTDAEDNEFRASVGFDYTLSRRVTTGLTATYFDREDNGIINVDADGYSIIWSIAYDLYSR